MKLVIDEAFFEFLREVMAVLSSDKTLLILSVHTVIILKEVDFDNIKNRIASINYLLQYFTLSQSPFFSVKGLLQTGQAN